MNLKKLAENYPKDFFNYAEKILDSYFGNIFITYRNEQILYVNERMANSVHMSKDEITNMSLAELRAKKLWLRSVSQEMYDSQKQSFNAYNVSKYGDELFTHIEPIFDESGELIMSAQFSIPRQMLTSFSSHIDTEKSNLDQYKDIVKYLEVQNTFSDSIYRYHYRQSTVSFSYILLILIRNKMIIEKAGQRTAAPPILYAYSIARISSTSD